MDSNLNLKKMCEEETLRMPGKGTEEGKHKRCTEGMGDIWVGRSLANWIRDR